MWASRITLGDLSLAGEEEGEEVKNSWNCQKAQFAAVLFTLGLHLLN